MASNYSSSLLDEELVALANLHSGGTSRQYPESGPSSSTHHELLQERGIKVCSGHAGIEIFLALTRGDPTALSNLLTNCMTEVNTIDIQGNTALHRAVTSACEENDWKDSLYQCIDLLMSCGQLNLNIPNKNGYTAMGVAVHHLHKTCVEFMLKHPSADRLYLDYYPGDSESTVREIIMETFPDLKPLLPAPQMESMDSSDIDIKLLAVRQRDEYKTFEENIRDLPNPNPWYDEPYHSSLLEIACQVKNRIKFVNKLLVRRADPKIKNRVTGMPFLHATARSGNLELLKLLLVEPRIDVNVEDREHRTILHWWARVSEKNPDDNKKLESCFNLLLGKGFFKNGSIEDQDSLGNTPFSIAVARGNRGRIILMLDTESGYTASAHMGQILQSSNKSLLEAILYDCFESNNEPAYSEELMVKIKFHALINMMNFDVVSHHKDLLKYSIIAVVLNLLWKKLKYVYFLNMVLYVIFLVFLTTYVLFSELCNLQCNTGVANIANDLLSHNDSNVTCGMSDEWRYNTSQFLRYSLMILLGFLCIREGCQLLVDHKDYIKSKEKWIALLLIIVTFTSCSGIVESIEVSRHLFAIAILLGWFELVLLLGRLPQLSVQMEMFKTVSLTFLRFMAGYIVLILAFALSFYIIFRPNIQGENAALFSNPFISILKTIVMFAGEYDASRLPFDTLPGTSHVIFLLFVLFVAIVLLNLMNGLAVGDTGKVREYAEILSLVARVRLIKHIFDLYIVLPCIKTLYPVVVDKKYVLYPNMMSNIGSTDLQSLQRFITEKRERNKKGKKIEYVENWKLFEEKQSTLQTQCEKMQQMLNKIMTHLNIPEP